MNYKIILNKIIKKKWLYNKLLSNENENGLTHQVLVTWACAHSSENCRNKKDGHKYTVTFANKKRGSLDFYHKTEWFIGSNKLKFNNVSNNYDQHYKNKLQHRNSTLSDNPLASVIIKGDSTASNHYFVAKDIY